jgi:hypothetical protein
MSTLRQRLRKHASPGGTKAARLKLAVFGVLLALGGLSAWAISPALNTPQESALVSVTLRFEGFDPEETTVQAGRFLLAVNNQSGAEGLVLRITREETGELVQELTVPAGAQDWSAEVELGAGGYLLSEVNHPAWLLHIIAQ